MTSRTDIAIALARAANPTERDSIHPAWADPEGQAAFERILAAPRTGRQSGPAARRVPRVRRRLAIGVGLAAVAGAAVAVLGLPGSPNHGGTGAAWAVTRNSNGSVTVSIKDYRDPAGLQAKLRKAGLRANVVTIANRCLFTPDGPSEGELAIFDGDVSTFHAPYTWERLFAGSPSYVMDGPVTYAETSGVLSGDGTTEPAASPIQFTVTAGELPPGDDLTIGFPQTGSPAAGTTMQVAVAASGAPLQCGGLRAVELHRD